MAIQSVGERNHLKEYTDAPFCPDSAIAPCRLEGSRTPPMLTIELAVEPLLRGYFWGGTRGDST